MPKYLITYTLLGKGQKYECIQKTFQTILRHEQGDSLPSSFVKLEDSVYLLEVNKAKHTLEHLAQMFETCLEPGDKFLIARLDGKGVWQGYPVDKYFVRPK